MDFGEAEGDARWATELPLEAGTESDEPELMVNQNLFHFAYLISRVLVMFKVHFLAFCFLLSSFYFRLAFSFDYRMELTKKKQLRRVRVMWHWHHLELIPMKWTIFI